MHKDSQVPRPAPSQVCQLFSWSANQTGNYVQLLSFLAHCIPVSDRRPAPATESEREMNLKVHIRRAPTGSAFPIPELSRNPRMPGFLDFGFNCHKRQTERNMPVKDGATMYI